MLFRRIKAHVEKENWFAVFLDFCIVVVGVFVGLQVQEWAQERERERQEEVYVSRLYDEVRNLESVRQPLLDTRRAILANLLTAGPVIHGKNDRPLTEAECDSIAMSGIVTNPTDDLATLIELQQAGGLTVFRDETVLDAIRTYRLTRARARDVLNGTVRVVGLMVQDYPTLFQFSSELDPSKRLEGLFICDLTAMRKDRGFVNTALWNSGAYEEHVRNNRLLSESLENLKHSLEAFMRKTPQHETTP